MGGVLPETRVLEQINCAFESLSFGSQPQVIDQSVRSIRFWLDQPS